ncbi:MAG TPA: ribonuclease H-like domain-containing protein, partial [Candidatus Caenarcaniphilales bacterium]|nr:ribonuclease H-like domain-containing protein [Candidatus Caenarcaniphilales bacterium]
MDHAATDDLLARRLDRLRTGLARPPTRPSSSGREQAQRLADELGGRAATAGGGAVVVFETVVALPLDTRALGELPYPIDSQRPLVCLDLETTGLGTAAGTLPFLVGIGRWNGAALTVTQLLLPDHADEPSMLSALEAAVPDGAWLVTYNGRSFDWPLIASRFRLHRRVPPVPAGHLDLLPVARQIWKHRLGDARLATVERLAGVGRKDDLPGALVPKRYFRYLRERCAEPLLAVLEHNRQDVVSLGLLLAVLADQLGRRESWPSVHPGDLYGLGRAYARRGRAADALACLDQALLTIRGRSVARDDGT